jgi:hypothetical protein
MLNEVYTKWKLPNTMETYLICNQCYQYTGWNRPAIQRTIPAVERQKNKRQHLADAFEADVRRSGIQGLLW